MNAIQSARTKSSMYFRGVWAEMQKVVWPSRRETIKHTLVVIVFSISVALFLGGLDLLFNYGLETLINNYR